MKLRIIVLIVFLFNVFQNVYSQFCVDTLRSSNNSDVSNTSELFEKYSNEFLLYAKKKSIESIDLKCKSVLHVSNILNNLNKGLRTSIFSKNILTLSIDSYTYLDSSAVNFGLIEIVFKNKFESKRAFKIFKSRRYFKQSEKILRIYFPILEDNRLLVFHTATPESELLKDFFYTLNIKDFILE